MKQITLLVAAFLVSAATLTAQTVLSHSTDQTTIEAGVSCANNQTGISTDNGYWRSYTPSDFSVTDEMAVTGVQFGVGTADGAFDGYTVTINIYTSDDVFPDGTFTMVTSQEFQWQRLMLEPYLT